MEPSPALPRHFPSSNPCSKLFHNFRSRQLIGIFVSSKYANPLRAQFIKQDHVCFCLGSCCPCCWPHEGPVNLCCFRTLNQAASKGLQVRATFIRRGSVFYMHALAFGATSSFLKSPRNVLAFSGSCPLNQSHKL